MTQQFHMTARDQEILQALVQKVRLFSQRQIADHWWSGEMPNARRRLRRLAASNLLARLAVHARPAPTLDAPLVNWRPGQAPPDFTRVAYRCQARWRMRPARHTTAWIATDQAAQLLGGARRGELVHALQATHDLAVAAVWLRLHRLAPQWAAAWQGEDLLAHTRRGEKLPDAFILDPSGRVLCVIEFGGGYDAKRVEAFHRDCAARNLPYQLW